MPTEMPTLFGVSGESGNSIDHIPVALGGSRRGRFRGKKAHRNSTLYR